MYGDVLSYSVNQAGLATLRALGRGGALAHRAPQRIASLEWMKARQVGLEPTTSRLIPTRRDSSIEQIVADPLGGFHFLDSTFSKDGGGSGGMGFRPGQRPRPVFVCERLRPDAGVIMLADPP